MYRRDLVGVFAGCLGIPAMARKSIEGQWVMRAHAIVDGRNAAPWADETHVQTTVQSSEDFFDLQVTGKLYGSLSVSGVYGVSLWYGGRLVKANDYPMTLVDYSVTHLELNVATRNLPVSKMHDMDWLASVVEEYWKNKTARTVRDWESRYGVGGF